MTRLKLLCVLIGLSAGSAAHAGNFQVSPVRAVLDAKTRSTLLTLSNRGAAPLRVQIDAYRWDETSAGSPVLDPTDQVVVFPSLLELAVGEVRTIRVGTTEPGDALERTYRIIIEEQPSSDKQAAGIAIRMRVSVPVFVGGAGSAVPRLEAPTVDAQGRLHASVVNDGARHFKPLSLIAVVTDGHGAATTVKIAGWYVLAHHRRDYVLALPVAATCVRTITLQLDADQGLIEKSYPIVDTRCSVPATRG